MSRLPWSLLPDTATVDDAGHLHVGGVDTVELAARYGTPLFVYDEAHLRERCREARAAFPGGVHYAAKAFLCAAMARLVVEEGLGLDVASGGELAVALAADVPADRLVLHGNNKSLEELVAALEAGVGRIVVDSDDEIDRLAHLVGDRGLPRPEVAVRVTPGVEAHTHDYIATGQADSKFGFGLASGAAAAAIDRLRAAGSPAHLVGLHVHIGSQIFRTGSFARALELLAPFIRQSNLPELSIGGGLGVAYGEGEVSEGIPAGGERVRKTVEANGISATVTAEPGRAIAAAAAITLYTAGTVKDSPGVRTYVATDGGMIDNPRPALYGSGYETFLPRAVRAERDRVVRLVGKHCESGDVLVRDARVPADLRPGDLVATPVTGAYGFSMGSNYNRLARPAVVFVADGRARLVVRRETLADLLATDCELALAAGTAPTGSSAPAAGVPPARSEKPARTAAAGTPPAPVVAGDGETVTGASVA
jgi:diaminopimelate decarboxylase